MYSGADLELKLEMGHFFRKYKKIIHNYKIIKVNYYIKLERYEYMKLLIFKIK
jgi:hypothetical protein